MEIISLSEAKSDFALRDLFIKAHIPFIIYTTSSTIGRYISIENDEEFSVALEAFNMAIDTFRPDLSKFETYATTVIKNRIIDFHRQQKKHYGHDLLDEGIAAPERDDTLRIEIADLSHRLKAFNMNFDDLVDVSPKHKDTRMRAIEVGIGASKHQKILDELNRSLKLPVSEILKVVKSTRRFIYLHSKYILAVTLIFGEEHQSLQEWILETLKDDEDGNSKS